MRRNPLSSRERGKWMQRIAAKMGALADWVLRFRAIYKTGRPLDHMPPWRNWYQANKRYQKYRRLFPYGPEHLPRHVGWWPK